MGNVVYKKKGFIITKCGSSRNRYYTLVNNNKTLKGQHTHLNTFEEAQFILNCAIKNTLPEVSKYLRESYYRVTIKDYKNLNDNKLSYETIYDDKYIRFCKKLNKKVKYYNSKGIRVIFSKCSTLGNVGYKAKVIKKDKYTPEVNNAYLWVYNKNNNTWI